jgi:hypothetical protein
MMSAMFGETLTFGVAVMSATPAGIARGLRETAIRAPDQPLDSALHSPASGCVAVAVPARLPRS